MASEDVVERKGSESIATGDTPSQETRTPLTLDNNGSSDIKNDPISPKDNKPLHRVDIDIQTKLEALKMKIAELEILAQENSAATDQNEAEQDAIRPEVEGPNSKPEFDIEEYRRMENFLYQSRKKWETKGPRNLNFGMDLRVNEERRSLFASSADGPGYAHGPWMFKWETWPKSKYTLPDPFILGNSGPDNIPDDSIEKDAFDIAIDFGCARDRLRKSFEWEMDRLFLKEEVSIRKRKKEEETSNKSKEPIKEEKFPEDERSAQVKLNEVDWFTFKNIANKAERDSFVIDVLLGEPSINADTEKRWYPNSERRARKAARSQLPKNSTTLTPGLSHLPERIRINSASLQRIMGVLRLSQAPGTYNDTLPGSSIILVRPFKALFFLENELRSWCTSLKEKFERVRDDSESQSVADASLQQESKSKNVPDLPEAKSEPTNTTTNEVETNLENAKDKEKNEKSEDPIDIQNNVDEEDKEDEEDPTDISRSKIALDHIKCLLDFMDTYILARKAHLDSLACTKVFFSDLWYLFRPGSVVIGRDGKQAYRVINVSSAFHRVVSSWEAWISNFDNGKDKNKSAAFSITCVYIDFDGKNLGPVSKTFDSKRFDGELEVTSLPVYPLRFHPVRKIDFSDEEWEYLQALPLEKRYEQKLINRGSRFLEVVSVKAMYYAGPTLGMRDSIESQVVIDFETAFSAEDKIQQEWKPELESLLGNPSQKDLDNNDKDIVQSCRASCCHDEQVHDDTYTDFVMRNAYIEGLLPKTGNQNVLPSVMIIPQPLKQLKDSAGKDYQISKDDRMIMSYRVFGFVLQRRQWAKLDISYLTQLYPSREGLVRKQEQYSNSENKETQEDNTALGKLVLEEGQKPMIQALVAQHFRDKESRMGHTEQLDIVKGKGKGLILLLHGAPGVGKTSTAEGVAEVFKKPLFQITCGDLGSTAKEVEKALYTTFTLANRWDCILLLDEADVFLAQRNKEDFQRNGLVAVFLRVLEYYAGVLFLTTNRVGDFDEAFTSRIHVSLYYPELSEEKTIQIFAINVQMITQRFEDKKRIILVDEVTKFAREHFKNHARERWNGRQIRNACQTALALAEFEAQGNSHLTILKPDAVVHLKISHFETVQKAYIEFAQYMNKLYGSTSATRAKENKIRAIWIDENNKIVSGQNVDGTYKSRQELQDIMVVKSQPQAQAHQMFQQPVPLQPQQGFQQQVFPPPNQGFPSPGMQQYYPYQNIAPPQAMYPQAGQMPMYPPQNIPLSQSWNSSGSNTATSQGVEQNRASSQLPQTPPPPQPHQQPGNPAWLGQNVQALYSAGSPQSSEPRSSSNPPGTGSGFSPGPSHSGQQWMGSLDASGMTVAHHQ